MGLTMTAARGWPSKSFALILMAHRQRPPHRTIHRLTPTCESFPQTPTNNKGYDDDGDREQVYVKEREPHRLGCYDDVKSIVASLIGLDTASRL